MQEPDNDIWNEDGTMKEIIPAEGATFEKLGHKWVFKNWAWKCSGCNWSVDNDDLRGKPLTHVHYEDTFPGVEHEMTCEETANFFKTYKAQKS